MAEGHIRVLLLHPEDSPWGGAWMQERWDLVVDLGFASSYTYQEWSRRWGSPVLSICQFAGQTQSYRWVDEVFARGRGRLLDRMGLDWWEILAMESYQDLQALYLCNQLRLEIASDQIELAASRPHQLSRILEQAFGLSARYFEGTKRGPVRRMMRMLRSARNLRVAQIAEIGFDKWDPGYRMRRHVMKHSRAQLADPAVLLPSAYSNVTRTALAYAGQLPHRRFLLVTTRRSALPDRLPHNVTAAPLAAYALPARATRVEAAELRKGWQAFLRTMLPEMEAFRLAANAGSWDYFPGHLENGLRLRGAWKHLLDTEPVTGVLCGDDLNYHTRLPLILAQRRGLNALYCSHGALDGGLLFKMPAADYYLVRGEMERDYLQSARAIELEKIWVGAPGTNTFMERGDQLGGALVFFSQPYEVGGGGRADAIYRELLPRLCSAAQRTGRTLIVKLHPFESKRARQALVTSILPSNVDCHLEIVDGRSPEEVMSRAWCGVTVDSSVAVECALRKIPFFLCGWLDFGGMGYMQQFARFGVGRVLSTPDDIEHIPEMVNDYRVDPVAMERLWHEANPVNLDEVMFGNRRVHFPDPCAC